MVSVVLFHAGLPLPGGFVGVDIFFVISGFVISAMLVRERERTGRLDYARFYLRRFKRLTPALAAMVTVVALLSLLLLSPVGGQRSAAATGLGAMMLVANLVIAMSTGGYFDPAAEHNPFLNTWSLSVEEQFYIFFPALLGLAWRASRSKRTPLLLVTVVCAVSLIAVLVGNHSSTAGFTGFLFGFYSPMTRAWEFGVGALLALVAPSVRSKGLATVTAVVGLLMIPVSLMAIDGQTPFPSLWTLLPVAATGMLILAGSCHDNPVSRTLSSGPLVRIGDWSYSIYLWHWPLIVFATLLSPGSGLAPIVAALLSIPLAVASYAWIEAPLRSMTIVTRRRLTTVVAATLLPPVLVCSTLLMAPPTRLMTGGLARSFEGRQQMHAASQAGCHILGGEESKPPEDCWWNRSASGPPLYLIGDSIAEQYSEAVIRAGEDTERPVWIRTGSSCPVVPGLQVVEPVNYDPFLPTSVSATAFDHCDDYVPQVLDYLRSSPPGVVFIAGLDQYWWDPFIGVRASGFDGPPSFSESDKLEMLRSDLSETVLELSERGHQVVIVQSIPSFRNPGPIWDPELCSVVSYSMGKCDRRVPLEVLDRLQRPAREVIDSVAESTGAAVLDLQAKYCGEEYCSPRRGQEFVYRDATHI